MAVSPHGNAVTVLAWGAGDAGQLGDRTTEDRYVPGPVEGMARADVKKLVSGGAGSSSAFTLALSTNGRVVSWGDNTEGQLGNGSTTQQREPALVSMLPPSIKDIAAGGTHALALDADGRVYAWGDNAYGQLGTGGTGDDWTVPRPVPGLGEVKAIAAGVDFSLALMATGKVCAWGRGIHGQIGNGHRATKAAPAQVAGLQDIVMIAAGAHHALALTADDTVRSWGYNLYGQLGNSSTKSSTSPVDVDWLEGVSDIAAGAFHTYARTSDGTVWGWGNNQYGQLLADGEDFSAESRTNRTAPVEISRLKGAQALAAGARHGLAIIDGDVYAWGDNTEGQLGNGTTTPGHHKVDLPGTDYRAVAASLGGNTTYLY